MCRACSRNRYPLKYLKDRVAKVCDHCYAELRKKGKSHLFVFCSDRRVLSKNRAGPEFNLAPL